MPVETCVPVSMPAVEASYCAPDLNFGQIDKIYLGNEGQPLTDWSDLAEWNTRLDNSDVSVDNDKIRYLNVVGSKPLPERTKIEFSQGRSTYTDAKHTVNLKVDETGQANYALVKWLEANINQDVRIWYQAGKYLYGGNTGILAKVILGDVIPESDEELNTFDGTAVWEGAHPERIVNPLA